MDAPRGIVASSLNHALKMSKSWNIGRCGSAGYADPEFLPLWVRYVLGGARRELKRCHGERSGRTIAVTEPYGVAQASDSTGSGYRNDDKLSCLNCQRVASSLTTRGAQSRFSVEDAFSMHRRATRIRSIRGAITKSSSASDECVSRPVGQPRGRSPCKRFQHCRSTCTGTTTNRILP